MKKIFIFFLFFSLCLSLCSCHSHSFDEWETVSAPNCTDSGERLRVCKECGEIETQILEKNGEHVYGDWIEISTPTCIDTGEAFRTCEKCSSFEEKALDPTGIHSYKNGMCTICDAIEDGASIIPPFEKPEDICNHVFVSTIFKADCVNDGYTLNECSKCDFYTKTNTVPASGHTGSTYCDVCGEAILPDDEF